MDQYIAELAGQRDEQGRRLVVRNGRHRPRTVTTAAGAVEVAAPRVNDKRVDEVWDVEWNGSWLVNGTAQDAPPSERWVTSALGCP